jgi:hypothetical protein
VAGFRLADMLGLPVLAKIAAPLLPCDVHVKVSTGRDEPPATDRGVSHPREI